MSDYTEDIQPPIDVSGLVQGAITNGEAEPMLAVIDDSIALEALDDFVIVQEDKFRTGFECKTCDGTGHSNVVCKRCKGTKQEVVDDRCDGCGGTGQVRNLFRALDDTSNEPKWKTCNDCSGSGKKQLGKGLEAGIYPCRNCMAVIDVSGSRAAPTGFEPCYSCKGKSVTLVVPEESLRRPNSGTVRSTGPKVTTVKCGDKVMYSNHTGMEVYFKRNLKFRQMRVHEIMARIHGLGELRKVLE